MAPKVRLSRRVAACRGRFVPALVTPPNFSEAAMSPERPDPAIHEVREIRQRISAGFDHDPARLIAYYMELQERHRDRLLGRSTMTEPRDESAVPGAR